MKNVTGFTQGGAERCSNHGVRILVVDSDARAREILIQRLRGRGFDAESAQTAAEAVDLLSAAKYDIVLLEVVMPHNAALEILRWIHNLALQPRCIIMSGVADLWKRANPDVKIAGVLQKPFKFEELLRLVG